MSVELVDVQARMMKPTAATPVVPTPPAAQVIPPQMADTEVRELTRDKQRVVKVSMGPESMQALSPEAMEQFRDQMKKELGEDTVVLVTGKDIEFEFIELDKAPADMGVKRNGADWDF
jgi:hypothetical protein